MLGRGLLMMAAGLAASAGLSIAPGPRAVGGTKVRDRQYMPTSTYYAARAGKAGTVAQARRAAKKKRNRAASR